ncbi:MAG: glycosyltransferase family 2 protein [Bacteroidota bacterium]
MLAPVCLFTYNRLWETKQTIEALQENFLAPESELIIFSDGPKNEDVKDEVEAVRKYISSISGFKSIRIIKSQENKGLAESIISGVTKILDEYGKIIVLEDDLVTRPNFLDFMNQALDFYFHYSEVRSVNGYSLRLTYPVKDIYFQKRTFPWGWGTWENRWDTYIFDKQRIKNKIEKDETLLTGFKKECGDDISKMLLDSINNVNNSWYVRWVFRHYTTDTYAAYPVHSFVENIGYSKKGTHCRLINSFESRLSTSLDRKFEFIPFTYPEERYRREFLHYFSILSKLMVRFRLLNSSSGREKVFDEIKYKLKLR